MRIVIAFILSVALFSTSDAYEKPENVSEEFWDSIMPYFLPENHPIKSKIDKIFGKRSVTKNSRTITKAGFYSGRPGEYSKVVVSGHSALKGYIVKMYLDSNAQVNEGEKFRERITGAEKIKHTIESCGFHDVLKVPQKWIYPIPTFAESGISPKQFILIAEDVHPYSHDRSLHHWKNKITQRQLKAVWTILTIVGLPDCAYAFNIPFCRDGKLAFLDTEQWGLWPVRYGRMHCYLKGDGLAYWRDLGE